VPRREEVVEVLAQQGMLPAIYFVFSRAGCDKSVRWLRDAGIRLTTREEAEEIRERAEMAAAWIDEADLVALGFYDFLDGLTAGIAAHHAGMLPAFKETVEELFEEGLVKVVFATETLSLGINMPAKTVVIEDLWKFQGERHELLTPGEYTQLAGRAGRRGIDPIGHAVVVFQRQVPFERANVRPGLLVPPLLQHGGQPREELHAGAGAPVVELLVRPVPRRSRRGRAAADPRPRSRGVDRLSGQHGV
jgi:superfamily II RNA helicase